MHNDRKTPDGKAPSERVLARPDPGSWGPDELLTLSEAAYLFWPNGPITTATLRTAVRKEELSVAEIASKFFTTRRSIEATSVPAIRRMAAKPQPVSAPAPEAEPKKAEASLPARTAVERLQTLKRPRRSS
ncbi:hypothetical protein PMN64_00470 [Bradyrhizobium sp. UFLA01-814]|uniref:hypothetical protein n=1 Tax=Bradyrhizobium sp. UFLA01-814 TaxID=3023480 RepID=UPI00398AAA21